eukprot:5697628-Pyramimonas_sp.AAC.1
MVQVGSVLHAAGRPRACGGDRPNLSESLNSARWPASVKGNVVAPDQATCCVASSARSPRVSSAHLRRALSRAPQGRHPRPGRAADAAD